MSTRARSMSPSPDRLAARRQSVESHRPRHHHLRLVAGLRPSSAIPNQLLLPPRARLALQVRQQLLRFRLSNARSGRSRTGTT